MRLRNRGARTCPWPGGRVSGCTCGMAAGGRCVVGSILRTIPWPSTAIPQVLPVLFHYLLLQRAIRDGLDLVARSKRASSSRRVTSISRDRRRPSQSMPCIVSCTVALPKYHALDGIWCLAISLSSSRSCISADQSISRSISAFRVGRTSSDHCQME